MARPKKYEKITTYIDEWQEEHYSKIMIKLPKEDIARIRAYAAFFGFKNSPFALKVCDEYAENYRNKCSDEKKEEMDIFISNFIEQYLKEHEEKLKNKRKNKEKKD